MTTPFVVTFPVTVGDTVYVLFVRDITETCPVCGPEPLRILEGSQEGATAVLLAGERFVCPKCKGEGIAATGQREWYVRQATVESMWAHVCGEPKLQLTVQTVDSRYPEHVSVNQVYYSLGAAQTAMLTLPIPE